MARSPLAQNRPLLPQDPMIRGPRLESYVPGYIRDSDLESALVRYPRAGGRLIEKGVGALMDDPLSLVTGALSGVVDQARESGDPLSFLQDSAVALGLPVVESGERLASGDYEGLTQEEEEEARLLDALTVAELIPMVGLGVKGVTGALRRRLRVENPSMDDTEIEAMVAQMELEATRPDPGGEDLGPRPAELGLDEFEAANTTPLAELDRMRDDFDTTIGNIPLTDDDLYYINRSREEDGQPPLTMDEAIVREYEEVFPEEVEAVTARLETEMGDDFGDLVPDDDTDATYYANVTARLNDVLDTQLPRYFGDTDQMTTSDALIGLGEDYVAELTNMGYGGADIFNDLDEALVARGYNEDQRRQLMDELFPPNEPTVEQNILEGLEANLEDPVFGPGQQVDPFGPGQPLDPWQFVGDDDGILTPMNQLEAMDFSMTGNDTKLNSRLEEVLLDPSAPKKFANRQDFINFLTNQKNGVTNAELEARGITEQGLSDGPIDLNDPDTRAWIFRDPLKVRILEGPDTHYKRYFLPNAQNYRETVITLDGSPFDGDMVSGGIVGDSQHFVNTQRSMGGPELLHMRTGEFEIVDPPTTEKPATVAGKTFHVGEIQSQATQDARKYRQARKTLTQSFEDLGGLDRVVEDMKFGGTFEEINEIESLRKRIDQMKGTDPEKAANLETFLQLDLEKLGFDSEADAIAYRDAFVERMRKLDDDPTHRYSTARNSLNSLIGLATDVNVDDLGVGSLYQTDRITNIAVKQALEQAIDTGADFITFNRGDLVHGMTGGKLEGHQEYYDKILPKNVNKLLAKLEKQNKVKLPRLEKLKLKTESGPELGRVLGFKLTPELKDIFKAGVQAFRRGGMVESRNLGLGSMSREVL